MNRLHHILWACGVVPMLLMLASCASAPVGSSLDRQLVPVGTGTHMMDGRQYVLVDGDSVRYDVAFTNYSADRLWFDVRITNLTSRSLTIDPEDFYYVASLDSAWAGTRFPVRTKSFGMNPAGERATIDTMILLEEESLRAAQGTSEYERLSENYEESLANLLRLRSEWDGVLETTTLKPGGKVSGRLVFFPRPDFRTVRLHFPGADSVKSITFALIEPKE